MKMIESFLITWVPIGDTAWAGYNMDAPISLNLCKAVNKIIISRKIKYLTPDIIINKKK